MRKDTIFDSVMAAFYPDKCPVCDDIITDEEFLCDYCFCMLERTARDKHCLKCGMPLKNCVCNKRAFHFDGCIAPLYNVGTAKEAMYEFKFREKHWVKEFFAQQIALSVKQHYYGINFDCICYVPMQASNEMQRGYNQSRLLASSLSKLLNIPLCENALICKGKKIAQHDVPFKQRFENVKGKYYNNIKLNGKTVLLIDDIKTTGATLDECAKQLYISGAQKVYCACALSTKISKGDSNGN